MATLAPQPEMHGNLLPLLISVNNFASSLMQHCPLMKGSVSFAALCAPASPRCASATAADTPASTPSASPPTAKTTPANTTPAKPPPKSSPNSAPKIPCDPPRRLVPLRCHPERRTKSRVPLRCHPERRTKCGVFYSVILSGARSAESKDPRLPLAAPPATTCQGTTSQSAEYSAKVRFLSGPDFSRADKAP